METKTMKVFVGIIETNVFGATAWNCRCFCCGWTGKRKDNKGAVVQEAKAHGKECRNPQGGLPAGATYQDVQTVDFSQK
jgi:hypothetical protein